MDSSSSKSDLKLKSNEQLLKLKKDIEKLLNSSSSVQKLPDKGQKLHIKLEEINQILKNREKSLYLQSLEQKNETGLNETSSSQVLISSLYYKFSSLQMSQPRTPSTESPRIEEMKDVPGLKEEDLEKEDLEEANQNKTEKEDNFDKEVEFLTRKMNLLRTKEEIISKNKDLVKMYKKEKSIKGTKGIEWEQNHKKTRKTVLLSIDESFKEANKHSNDLLQIDQEPSFQNTENEEQELAN